MLNVRRENQQGSIPSSCHYDVVPISRGLHQQGHAQRQLGSVADWLLTVQLVLLLWG